MAKLLTLALLVAALMPGPAAATQRIKDMANVSGVRSNQLVGYGLVVGLDGTGDQTAQTPFTAQSFRNMLQRLGIQMPPGQTFQLTNVAAVAVHADLPPFAKPGQAVDVTVSSVGNAGSLRGGTLLVTPLKALDGEVYAVAQGSLVVGGFGAQGNDGSRVTVNVPSVGRIPGGGLIERSAPSHFTTAEHITFNLHRADFTTARRVAEKINATFGPQVASTLDGASISVRAPLDTSQRVAFLSVLENLTVEQDDAAARVVINSRTGTIVIGEHVKVTPAAITHGSLTVTIAEDPEVVQPAPFAAGAAALEPDAEIEIIEESNRMFYFAPGVALQDIVTAVNEVGAAPGDLMAILEALRQAGALQAELVVI